MHLFVILILIFILLFIIYLCTVFYFLHFSILSDRKKNNGFVGNNSEYEPFALEAYEWLHQHDQIPATVTSYDNLQLVGHYFESPYPQRTILFFHGWHGTWDGDFAPLAKWCYEQGSNLLIIEERGQGNSAGNHMGMGILERKDVSTWLSWYQTHQQTKYAQIPVYLMGISMGCATVLMSVTEPYPIPVSGIIADCGFTSPYGMFADYAKRGFHLSEFPILSGLHIFCKQFLGLDLKSYSTIDALQNNTIPILFAHGEGDDFVLPQNTEQNYEATKGYKDILLVPNAGHCMSYLQATEDYRNAVQRLWNHVEK